MLHAADFHELGELSVPPPPPPSLVTSSSSPPNFPWEVFSHKQELHQLGEEEFANGRALILYPERFLPSTNDTEFLYGGNIKDKAIA